MALAAAALFIFLPMQTVWADMDYSKQSSQPSDLNLPSALAEDDSFDELPFEQLRQALREEVERDPTKTLRPHSSKRYNLLIR